MRGPYILKTNATVQFRIADTFAARREMRYGMAVRICPRFCFCGESMKVKYSAYAECEIIHFVNCEILLLQVAM